MRPVRKLLANYLCNSVAILAMALLSVLTACHSAGDSASMMKRKQVLFVCLSLSNPFYKVMSLGLHDAGKQAGIDVIDRSGENATDVAGQVRLIRTFLAENSTDKIDGIVIVPADSGSAIANVVREANDAHVPVINLDIAIKEEALRKADAHIEAFIGSDNILGGKAAANTMHDALPRGGLILTLLGGLGEATTQDRRKGFADRLAELGKKGYSTRVIERSGNWSEAKADIEVSTLLASGVHVNGIFAENDLMALGAARAIDAKSLPLRPVIIGYDATPEAIAAIEKRQLQASISQNPDEMGRHAIHDFLEVWAGRPIKEVREFTPVSVVGGRK